MAWAARLLLLGVLAGVIAGEQSASFYGESYISVPMQDDSSVTDLFLRFKTHRPHGLLLLAAGATDYFLVEVKSGMVEVRVNLGSGEAIVFSSPAVRLDDHQWHEVQVNRSAGTVALTVDRVYQGSVDTPGTLHELNTQDGIFLGGVGAYSKNHANLKDFRGCMQDVVYNQNDVLTIARDMKNAQNAFEISWDCDEEFSAGSDVPVSFLSDTSFIAFSHFHVRERGSFACDFKTRSSEAVMLFNSGRGSFKDDFLALELIDGWPKLSVNSGSGVVEVVLAATVNDGNWHQLDLTISQTSVELRVDSTRNTTRFGGDQSYINLAGHLFVGGVGLKARSHALHLGLESLQGDRSLKGSMLGCIRNIVISSRPYGFRELQVSRHVDPGCSWSFPCAAQPCVGGAECIESGEEFQCVCGQPVCTKEDRDSTTHKLMPEEERIAVQPLSVQEGGQQIIDTNAIDVIFDYRMYRIREIAVRFRVMLPPRFGRLEVDRGRRQSESFTLLDLLTNKVNYVHDGTDSSVDDITLEMSISTDSTETELPQKLRGNFEFVLPIKIIPHNDPPKFQLPSGNQINMTADSKLQITTDAISVRDPDTSNSNLKYHVHYLRPVSSYFENYNTSGEPITLFTHQDVVDGVVWFVHQDDMVVDVRFNVTDDSALTDSVIIRIRIVPLELSVVRNTGLIVPYTTNLLLHPDNLTTSTNIPLENLEVRYRITKPPRLGQIQRLQQSVSTEEWTDVDTFTQRQLDKFWIRYSHQSTDFAIAGDEFFFIISAKDLDSGERTFKVSLTPVALTVKNNLRQVILKAPFAKVTNRYLLVVSDSGQIDETNLVFIIFRAPKLGALYHSRDSNIMNPLDFDSLKPLNPGSNFTQADINAGHIYFKFHKPTFERLEDYMDLTVKYPSSAGKMIRVLFEYSPQDTTISYTNYGLPDVAEGGQKVIEKSALYLEMVGAKEFQFSLIRPPLHGNISIIDPRTYIVKEPKVEEFTTTDIREGRLMYKHDDSENSHDSFSFTAVPIFDTEASIPEEIQELSGTFHITVAMRNDNAPERVIDKVFYVVSNGRRKITLSDLAFTDKDMHFNVSGLQYRRQAIPNGEILRVDSGTPVYQFTQKDLQDETLVFQHRGDSFGRATIFVTDGQFVWTGLFEIQASDPYIAVKKNTGVSVHRGGKAVISSANLSIESNMNDLVSNFNFIMIEEPRYGQLKIDVEEVAEFTYSDIMNGQVFYVHDGSASVEDKFKFAVVHGDVQTQGTFPVTITDVSVQHSPEIIHNQRLRVREGEGVKITQSQLLVQHPALNAEEIVLIVTSPPSHGVIKVKGVVFTTQEPIEFTQGDINRGLVEYVQTSRGVVDDRFTFDIDTDSRGLKNVVVSIEIIPGSLPVQVGNLTVIEGGTVVLSKETLKTISAKYELENLIYEILTVPLHGFILNSEKPKSYNMAFSTTSVSAGKIIYQHDDSESLNDTFSVVASREDGSLKSQPVIISVTVNPRDDQPPRVVVNKGLSVWADSVTLVTNSDLHANDPDTDSRDVIIKVSSPTNGHLAFLNNTFHRIAQFSQLDIDSGQVVFIHKGKSHGQFSFQATDGINDDILQTFHVRAHPVVLELKNSGPLAVFPNTIHPVSNASLLAVTTSTNFTKPIFFTVVEPKPRKGKVVTVTAGRPLEISQFSQDDVNQGKVFYQHTAYMSAWQQTDAIHIEVSTTYAITLRGEVCDVDISFGNINPENQAMLLGLYKVSVEEGGSALITRTHFDSTELLQRLRTFQEDVTMTFEVMTPPQYGKLFLADTEIKSSTALTQHDIDSESLRYEHDDSDTLEDMFVFSVDIRHYDGGESKGSAPKHMLNFTIEVQPVNDQEFELVTRNPNLQVLQGGQATLTRANLLTSDPDTLPSDIIYTVLSNPTNGRLATTERPEIQVKTFTQQDIDSERLIFFQDGSSSNEPMYFEVTDGKFPPLYKMLDIFVTPVEIDTSRLRSVELVQSESSVFISEKYLNVSTNGERQNILYTILEAPKSGRIMLKGQEAVKFSQQDVDALAVLYVMQNFSSSEDSFMCDITLNKVNVAVRNQTIIIMVKPLVSQSMLVAPGGATVAITRANLDATELATRTGDNPVFEITSPPRHGQILRKLRKKRELIAQPVLKPVEEFTFEDILYAKIFYVSKLTEEDGELPDSFAYILRANNAQPAHGRFYINKDKEREDATPDVVAGEVGEDVLIDDSDDDDNNLMIVGIVLGVLILIVTVVVILVFVWRRRQAEEEHEVMERSRSRPRPFISGPLQLEQPHVHIEPQQSPEGGGEGGDEEERCLMRDSSNLSSIPIINVSHDSSDAQMHARKPGKNGQVGGGWRGTGSPPPPSRSPDLARTEISSAVPDCKVTPLVEVKGEGESSRPESGTGVDRRSGRSSTSTDLFDWTLMDPDLLEHCRTETPVLRDNQYWV